MDTSVIFILLWSFSIGVFIIIKALEHRISEKDTYTYALQKLEEYAEIVVRYAKDFGDEEGLTGKGKRDLAIKALLKFKEMLKLNDISYDQIEMLVRSAYTVMHEGEELED